MMKFEEQPTTDVGPAPSSPPLGGLGLPGMLRNAATALFMRLEV